MTVQNAPRRKRVEPRWVVSKSGQPMAVLVDIDDYNDMQRRLGEIATREEENAPDALALLEKAEADIRTGRVKRHAVIVKSVRRRRRNG